MFYEFRRKIMEKFQTHSKLFQIAAYCVVVFLILQCYGMSQAFQEDLEVAELATIGDATYTSADMAAKEQTTEQLSSESDEVENNISDLYRVNPNMNHPFVAYAMSISRGEGMYADNQCAIYVASVLSGYYKEKAPVSGATLVSQISNTLNNSPYWNCVYANAECFPVGKTEEEYDAIFSSLTKPGDIICFVDNSLDNYVHCSIAGGGTALIGHLFSSGWDCLRAGYYIDNAVDTRKECSGMMIYRYNDEMDTGTIRVCKSYDESVYLTNPAAYDIGGACYAVYLSRADAENSRNAKGYCYIEPEENGVPAKDNVSENAKTKPGGEGTVVRFSPGTVYVREYWAPKKNGWEKDDSVYETQIYAGKRTTLGIAKDSQAKPLDLPTENQMFDKKVVGPEKPRVGQVGLIKKVSDEYIGIIDDNSNYNYLGIEYSVYRVKNNTDTSDSDLVGVFTMDKQGNGTVTKCDGMPDCVGETYMQLPFGWYMIKETKTNSSMELDSTPKWIEVSYEKMTIPIIDVYDKPWVYDARLLLRKKGPDGEAVADAKYRICYYKESMESDPAQKGITPQKTWVFKTDKNGEIHFCDDETWFAEGEKIYKDETGMPVIPAGTITFEEIYAPPGYIVDETVYVKMILAGDTASLSAENPVTVIEEKEQSPKLMTKAWYDQGKLDKELLGQHITVTDTVSCSNLIPGHTYKLIGEAHHKDDGSSLQYNGADVIQTKIFDADQEVMDVPVCFDIVITEELIGKQLVFFETLYDMESPEEIVAEHKNIEDVNQTIEIPNETTTEETTTEQTTTEETTTEVTTAEQIVKGDEAVKTGDNGKVFVVLLIACTAATGIVSILIVKKKHK